MNTGVYDRVHVGDLLINCFALNRRKLIRHAFITTRHVGLVSGLLILTKTHVHRKAGRDDTINGRLKDVYVNDNLITNVNLKLDNKSYNLEVNSGKQLSKEQRHNRHRNAR